MLYFLFNNEQLRRICDVSYLARLHVVSYCEILALHVMLPVALNFGLVNLSKNVKGNYLL